MSEAARYIPHYTIADYQTWEGDWELWGGVPVSMTPSPGEPHQIVAGNLYSMLREQLHHDASCPCRVVYELDWRIDEATVVCPDISVLCDPTEGGFIARPPSLIVEVLSPATAGKDRVQKRRLYAEQGVGYYLLADPAARTLETLKLVGGDYQPADNQPMHPHPGCTVSIDVARLWT